MSSEDTLNLDRNARYRQRAMAVHDLIDVGRDLTFHIARADWPKVQELALRVERQAELLQKDPGLQLNPWNPSVGQLTRIEEEGQLTLEQDMEGGESDGDSLREGA